MSINHQTIGHRSGQNLFFTFDANVLLNIYRYSPATLQNFWEILNRLKDQIWLTHQAGSGSRELESGLQFCNSQTSRYSRNQSGRELQNCRPDPGLTDQSNDAHGSQWELTTKKSKNRLWGVMRFPPWDSPDPTDEQLLPFMHADTRQLYETGEMNRAKWQQLRDGIVAEYKAAQQSRSNKILSTSYDNYTIHGQIGQGANGFVYKVTSSSGSEFALKLLDPRTATEDKRKRFKNELGFCERNKHKNIITVIDRGVFEDAPFYVMHRYEGSLRDLMHGPIEHNKILPIFSQILDGVEAAHLQNVIHRDLKPENILFDHASQTPVIADFGIAHFEEEDLITAVETNDGRSGRQHKAWVQRSGTPGSGHKN